MADDPDVQLLETYAAAALHRLVESDDPRARLDAANALLTAATDLQAAAAKAVGAS